MLPEAIGPYRLVDRLGAGGMGEVYLARDTRLDRPVALKMLPREYSADADRVRRLQKEARAASALTHPAVARVYEIGEGEGGTYIVMEHVEGETLAAVVQRHPLPVTQVVDTGLAVAGALEEAHAKGIVHRDVKPANLMVTPRGHVKVLDFGLAKLVRPALSDLASATTDGDSGHTSAGVVLGTLRYMSPEQARGQVVDGRSDLFSLGVTLFELASGRPPFGGSTSAEILDRVLNAPPPLLSRLRDDTPAELERILNKCLEKEPGRRYQSASDLAVDLRNLRRDLDSRPAPFVPPPASSGPGLVVVASRALQLNPRRWWEIDLVACIAAVPLLLYLGWRARTWVPEPWGLLGFVSMMLAQVLSNTVRLYHLVLALFELRSLPREVRRSAPLIRACDSLLMFVMVAMGAAAIAGHPLGGATLLGLGAAGLVRVMLAEGTMIGEAFPEEPSGPR